MTIILGATGCSNEPNSGYQDYLNSVVEKESGLVSERTVGQKSARVSYLSGEYLAYQYLRSLDSASGQSVRDSILTVDEQSFALRLTFSSENTDPLAGESSSYGEYRDRSLHMNFDLANDIVIRYGERRIAPVSAVMENDYAMNGRRSVMAYFANDPAIWKQPSFEVVYSDHLFDMGVLHFRFNTADLKKAPNPLSGQDLH